VTNGILLALLAYATYAWSDAAIKALGGTMSVFEIGFYQTAIAGGLILLTRPNGEGWLDFWRMRYPIPVQARALVGLTAAVISVYAFTTIPLAEVYALVFLSPLFVTILSMLLLKEQIGPWRWFAIVLGFVGVLLVVRPGFRTLELGHAAALAMSILSASSVILTRSLAGRERTQTIIGYLIVYGVLFNGAAMAATSGRLPGGQEALILLFAGACAAAGHMLLLRAVRFAQANQIAPTHYSQIAWAVLLGALLFDEQPDLWSIVGLAVIAGSGLLTVFRERVRLGTVRWNPFGRPRI
jgi:drug/metabolite transporter (DMT)-like permease